MWQGSGLGKEIIFFKYMGKYKKKSKTWVIIRLCGRGPGRLKKEKVIRKFSRVNIKKFLGNETNFFGKKLFTNFGGQPRSLPLLSTLKFNIKNHTCNTITMTQSRI